ncbi:hypothetical protein DKAM_0666 [Desulfurococcus amylolyticus 1221n]|uniref:Uncharacterized protein n=1 Tax=Desulfurococcus amylolyticus (strain DSM 18924 / JCM 16383 / VKM B-2413 / 1221n) TaxID=490899 RepID=B8D4G1_DESA1|nr:hypothetical protein DKAM_0666 [Desulfurococcus amylolyticus 1221n]
MVMKPGFSGVRMKKSYSAENDFKGDLGEHGFRAKISNG